MEIKELVKEAFDCGYTSYHECNTDLDYQQHLEDCYVSILDSEYENNNGWIKILSEDDLPKEEGLFWVYNEKMKNIVHSYFDLELKFRHGIGHTFPATHYQPIEKPKPPIY